MDSVTTKTAKRIETVSQEMQEIASKHDGGAISDPADKEAFETLYTELKDLKVQGEALGLADEGFKLVNEPADEIGFDVKNHDADAKAREVSIKGLAEQLLGPREDYKGLEHWQPDVMIEASVDWAMAMDSKLAQMVNMLLKTAVTTANAGDLVVPDYRSVIPTQDRQLHVRDIFFSPGATGSNLVIYPALTAETNAAEGVAEGGTKPESAFTWTNQEHAVRKIADTIPVSEEMLSDYAQMQTWLENRLGFHIEFVEDSDLMWGAGAPTVTGILNTAGVLELTAASTPAFEAADTYYDIIRKLRYLAAWGGTNENTPMPTDVMVSTCPRW